MPGSYANVPTSRAARYLTQLCSHGSTLSRLAGHRPPGPGHGHADGGGPPAATVTVAGTEGIIDFGWGRCTLHADTGTLTLHAEAADPQRLRQIQESIGTRLRRIGRRDQLTVTWTAESQGSGSQEEAGK